MTFEEIHQAIKDFREPKQDYTTQIFIYAPEHLKAEIEELTKGSIEVKVVEGDEWHIGY